MILKNMTPGIQHEINNSNIFLFRKSILGSVFKGGGDNFRKKRTRFVLYNLGLTLLIW